MVFEPLTKCCKCRKPAAYAKDFKGRVYCKKHSINKPKRPAHLRDRSDRLFDFERRRFPRRMKKRMKKGASKLFTENGFFGKVVMKSNGFRCGDRIIDILFGERRRKLARKWPYKRTQSNHITQKP